MFNLATLRQQLLGNAGPNRIVIYVLGGLLLAALAWWLAPFHRSAAQQAAGQPSPLRRVSQRVVASPPTPKLQIAEVRQTGQVVEIKGTAECDAAVMINGERVPLIFENCGFKHFLLLPDGPSTIAVTAQGPAGGVNTQLLKINIEQ